MNRVKKLTPELLKRIINEEKQKLKNAGLKSKKRKKISEQKSINSDVVKLKKLKATQVKLVKALKKLHEQRKRLKRNLTRRL